MITKHNPLSGESQRADQSIGGGVSSTRTLSDATGHRAALRRLLQQIDLDEPVRRRAIQQTILEASAWWWRWRAEDFDRARPRRSDFNGNASPEALAAADERCRELTQACLNRATLLEWEAGND